MYHQKPLLGQLPISGYPLAPNILCMPFNETSGDKVSDLSLNGNNGILGTDTVFKQNAIYFDGTGEVVIPLNNLALSKYTIITKVKLSVLNDWDVILSLDGIGGNTNYRIQQDDNTPKHILFRTHDGSSGNATSTTQISAGIWYTIAATNDGTTQKIYIDGIFEHSCAEHASLGTSSLYFGRYSGAGADMEGFIEYVYIYNHALTPSEIQQLYINPYCMFMPIFDSVLFGYASAAAGGLSIPIAMYYQMHHNQ